MEVLATILATFIPKVKTWLGVLAFSLGVAVFVVLIDLATGYPSMSFNKNKYELIETLVTLRKDERITDSYKKELDRELSRVVRMQSMRDYTTHLRSRARIASNAIETRYVPNSSSNTISILNSFIGWVMFAFCSSFLPLVVLVIAFKQRSGYITYLTTLLLLSLFVLIAFLNLTISLRFKHILRDAWLTQGVLVALISFAGHVLNRRLEKAMKEPAVNP